MTTDASKPPWILGRVSISRAVLDAVDADALKGYAADEEACGYLRGPAGDALCDEHQRMVNTANKLHAMDPETYFRTGRTFFSFNEKKFADAIDSSEREGRPVKVLYHSHLDAGAYFSPTDAAVMSMGEPPAVEGGPVVMGPGPAWPLAFLVISVRSSLGNPEGGFPKPLQAFVAERGLFVWDGASKTFAPAELVVT